MKFDLYLWMFPTFLEHTSLAIVDMTPLYQSQWTVMELQVFLFTLRLFSKLGHKICNQKLSSMYNYCSLYDRSFIPIEGFDKIDKYFFHFRQD